jgi:hypothetical protein
MLDGSSPKNYFDTEDISEFEDKINYLFGNALSYYGLWNENTYRDYIALLLKFRHSRWWKVETENTALIGRSYIRVYSNLNEKKCCLYS